MIFQPFSNQQQIKQLSLYIVSTKKPNFFLNNQYNLVYGLFLEKIKDDDIEILYYKDPSFIKKVNYSEILTELFNTDISNDKHEDMHLKN